MRFSRPFKSALTILVVGFLAVGPLYSQVFAPSPDAAVGEVTEGTGPALYGNFGLNAKDHSPNSYSLYRKLFQDQGREIHTLNPVAGNDSAAVWRGIDHGGEDSGYHDPGIYLGNSPSTSTYADQLIYFGWNENGSEDVGGDNIPAAAGPDSNLRVNWEVSVGFIEDPDGFVDGRAPHTEAWDLWSGTWGTDGIQQRLFFTASDSEDLDSTDWFSFHETVSSVDTFPGSKLRSGDPDSIIGGEDQPNTHESVRRRVGSGEAFDEFEGDFEAGGGDGAAVYIGVGYDDKMELSWKMELNDPGNVNPVAGREVRFSVKTGNLEYVSVFDPGAPGSSVIPNDAFDPDTPFSDGYFDWENSTPIFYLGLDNGTDYGEEGASGLMGVFLPGDFNADGTVNNDDRNILNANMDTVDTTYSRGDLDQDGDTDADDLSAFMALNDPAAQIDAITNLEDRINFVHDVIGTWMGDSNLDGEFNSTDFVVVFSAAEYEDGIVDNSTWVDGDWNGDGDFDSSDFVVAFIDGGYEKGPLPPAANSVPEPDATTLLLPALLIVFRKRPALLM